MLMVDVSKGSFYAFVKVAEHSFAGSQWQLVCDGACFDLDY